MNAAPGQQTAGVIGRLVSIGADFWLAGVFLATWLWPLDREDRVRLLLLVMLLEFITIHSSGFMGNAMLARTSRRSRAMTVLGFGGFYTLFIGGFALAFSSWWPIVAFWLLTLNRIGAVLFLPTPSGERAEQLRNGWARGVVLYVSGAFLTLLPVFPALGLTPEVIAELDLPSSGLWVDEPYRVLGFGVYYFGLTAALDLRGLLRSRRAAPDTAPVADT